MSEPRAPEPDDLACVELVDSVTEYLEGDVNERQKRAMERHLEGCEGCRVALDQFQTAIRLSGRLTPADVARIDAMVRDRLMANLRVTRRR
jgi:hypothetical protein